MNGKPYQEIWLDTAEPLQAWLSSTTTPIATPPEWSLVAASEVAPGTFEAGSWGADGWSEQTGLAEAISPLVGSGQTLDVERGLYRVFVRWYFGSSAPVKELGLLLVR